MSTIAAERTKYLSRLLRFALREHPVMLANLGLAFLSVLLELAAVVSILPLSILAAGGTVPADSRWVALFGAFGVTPTFSSLLLYFVVLFAARLITNFLNQATSVYLGKRVQADLSARAFETLVTEMSLRDIDAKPAGHFISLAGDETARAGAIVTSFNQILASTLLALVYLAAIFYFSAALGAGVVLFLLVALLSLRGTLRRSQSLSTRQLGEAKVAHSVFLDALNGLRSVRALSAEAFVTSKYRDIIRRYTLTHFAIDTLGFAARLVPALTILVCVGAFAAAGRLSVAGPEQLAFVVTALAFLLRFFPASGQVLALLMRLLADLRAAADVTHLLPGGRAGKEAPRPDIARHGVREIELRQVTFGYKPDKPVLRELNATFRRGRTYALMGPSGSGKSTIFDLLLAFYAPDSGSILVNGRPVDLADSRELRRHMVLVGQQVAILNDTVANNIRFGSVADHARVRRACEAVCLDSYVDALPQGYETVLHFQGSNLSGGQRQRIAVARALLRDPEVLLLDESTSGLDVETRDAVVRNIMRAYRDRIVVFATHDKDLASRVDEVVTMPAHVEISEQDDLQAGTPTERKAWAQ